MSSLQVNLCGIEMGSFLTNECWLYKCNFESKKSRISFIEIGMLFICTDSKYLCIFNSIFKFSILTYNILKNQNLS